MRFHQLFIDHHLLGSDPSCDASNSKSRAHRDAADGKGK